MFRLAAAVILSVLTFWMPVGSRVHVELFAAMIRSPWYLPLTGCMQLGMTVGILVLTRKKLFTPGAWWLVAGILALVAGILVPAQEVPPFVSGIITMATGLLFLIQSGMKLNPLNLHGVLRLILILTISCLGVIPGAGVLSMAMLAALITGEETSEAYSMACMASLWPQAVSGISHITVIPSLTPISAATGILAGCIGFVLAPLLVKGLKRWFQNHTLLVFGLWRLGFGAVFLLVFCIL